MDLRRKSKKRRRGTDSVPVPPRAQMSHLGEFARCWDSDGTLLRLETTPREVWGPAGLAKDRNGCCNDLRARRLVRGRELNGQETFVIRAGPNLRAVGGHGAEIRILVDMRSVAPRPPLDQGVKKKSA